jgi:hypothetical protein
VSHWYASQGDVEDRLGRALTDSEINRAASLLDYATALVGAFIGGREFADGEVPPLVQSVTVSVVERGLRNPSGFQQESAGPFSHSMPTGWAGSALSQDEKDMLSMYMGRYGIVSVRAPVTDAYLEAVGVFGDGFTSDESEDADDSS